MKKAMFLFMLLVLAATLSAQTGLFGIWYGAKAEDVKALLKSQGFGDGTQNGAEIDYTPPAESKLPKISLTLTDDHTLLSYWSITYYLSDNPDVMLDILSNIAQVHGEASVVADFGVDYIWYFPDNHALYVYEYSDKAVLNYTNGNWDDDDYYWYEEYWY